MRITRLNLKNYKCFEELNLGKLGNRVVLVGPNGCGKSAILEAIAATKEYVATYNPDEDRRYKRNIDKHLRPGWPTDIPLPIRSNQSSAEISVEIALDESEQALCSIDATVQINITIERTGEVKPKADGKIATLLRHYDPESGIGVIDYISPHRIYPMQQVTSFNLGQLSLDQQRRERIELQKPNFDYQKFRSVKQFIISKQLEDTSHRHSTGEDRDSLKLLKELFQDLFPLKTLVGYKEVNGEMQIVVETPYGEHDLDLLSSGEKELFFILVNLFRIRSLPSVILYDEPERHLNVGLESEIIPALDKLQTKNQIWMATHSIELIDSVPLQDIIELKRAGGTVQIEQSFDESRERRVQIFEALGARRGLQFSSNRIVFVEGKKSNSDKAILEKLTHSQLTDVLFVAGGSSNEVKGAGNYAQLIEEASMDATFLMVLDRDFDDDEGVEKLRKRFNNRAFIWDCHELENLLLQDSEALLKVLINNGVVKFSATKQVEDALLEVAKELEDLFVYQWSAFQLSSEAYTIPKGTPACPRDAESFWNWIQERQNDVENASGIYSKPNVESILENVREQIKRSYMSAKWEKLLPGKEILAKFRAKYIEGLRENYFRNQVVASMLDLNRIPSEIDRLCNFIRQFQ